MFSVSFVIPCYNCEKFIIENIKKLKKKISSFKIQYEIILIDDGSNDDSCKKIKDYIKQNKFISLIENKRNQGKSFSVIKGIKKSKYNFIIMIDCDLPYFNSLNKIVFHLKNKADLVMINRRLKGSKLKKEKLNLYQISRYILGAIIAFINKILLNISVEGGDTQAGLKGFKKNSVLMKNKFISKKFFFDLELIHLFLKKKLKIVSIKTNYFIPKKSSIKILNFKNNYSIFKELLLILILKNLSK